MTEHDPQDDALRDQLRTRLVEQTGLSPDDAERTELVFDLTRFFNRLAQDSESVQRPLGWTWAGFRLLNLLWAAGPVEARRLRRLSGSSRAAISSLLGTLERDGLVRRERSGEDRRQVWVALTDAGRRRLAAGQLAQAERDRAWFAALAPEEARDLGELVRRLADQPTPGGGSGYTRPDTAPDAGRPRSQ